MTPDQHPISTLDQHPTSLDPSVVVELGSKSTQQLREELAQALTLTAHTLRRLALIWRELENRGEDLSELRNGLASYLPMIAAGQLDPDAVVSFAGNKTLLDRVSRLPVGDQHRLALGEKVEVISISPRGEEQVEQLPAISLMASQARLVFEAGRIRSVEEQRSALRVPSRRGVKLITGLADSPIKINAKNGTLRIGRTEFTPAQALAAIAALSELTPHTTPDHDELTKNILVKLSPEEHRTLNVRCAQAEITQLAAVRTALKSLNLI